MSADGIDGTEDDTPIKGNDDASAILGLNPQRYAQLQPFLSPGAVPIFRVVSVGTAGTAKRTIQMVFRRVGVLPQVITWREF